MRFGLALVILLTVSLAGCGGSSANQAAAVPSSSGPPATLSGTMVIVRGDDLWAIQDPVHELQLTHEANSNFANNPTFSPDGSSIAYTHHIAPTGNEWGGAELHVIQADGSGDKTLVPAKAKGERAESPAWTPDGKAIYFAHDVPIIDASNRYTGDTLTIDRIDVATGDRRTVVKDAIFPTISKSGAFAWVTYDASTSAFKLMVGALDGSQGHALVSEKDFQAVFSPRLSPDGKAIVFAGSGRTKSKVASVGNALVSALNPLLAGTAEAHGLPWDPWTINVDGSGMKRVMSLGSDEQALAWSPDGQEIAVANLSATYLMRADGSGVVRLLQHGDPGGITWKAGARD